MNIMNITEQTTIYIAGPMTGRYLLNYPAFFAMEGMLKKEFRCNVLNPARQPNGLSYQEYMKLAFADIEKADALVALNDWDRSNGARSEFYFAKKMNKKIFHEFEIFSFIDEKFRNEFKK